ncbi:response regulator transcription factor [Balneolales bacterium ANBcel1]|nr:response regulator transcription factor [Balneolales bacterium ANBcel1]
MTFKIIIVEDHPLMQKGMEMTLQAEADFEVVGIASSAEEAIGMVEEKRPDLAIIDISLPGMSGLELIRNLRSQFTGLKALVVSRHEEELFAERAIRAGAQGYMMKMHAGDQVVEAVRRIADGGLYLSEKISNRLLMGLSLGHDASSASPSDALSDRELQVFRLIGEGKSTRTIAERMHISTKTVDTYKTRIREKLHINDRSTLLQQAVQWVKEL